MYNIINNRNCKANCTFTIFFGERTMNVKKVTLAIIIGGIIGTMVAFTIRQTPGWVLIGMLSGMSLAYLVCDLREIQEKIPLAWEEAKVKTASYGKSTASWLKKSHPFLLMLSVYFFFWCSMMVFIFYIAEYQNIIPDAILLSLLAGIVFGLLSLAASMDIITVGIKKKKMFLDPSNWTRCSERLDYKEKGYKKVSATYGNVYGIFWAGITELVGRMVRFTLSKRLPIFLFRLLKMIHSKDRVASAFYAGVGIFISCLLFGRTAESWSEMIFAYLSGGIIGASIFNITNKLVQIFIQKQKLALKC